jgi:hypothetical protein
LLPPGPEQSWLMITFRRASADTQESPNSATNKIVSPIFRVRRIIHSSDQFLLQLKGQTE